MINNFAASIGVNPTDVAFAGGIGSYDTAQEYKDAREQEQRMRGESCCKRPCGIKGQKCIPYSAEDLRYKGY